MPVSFPNTPFSTSSLSPRGEYRKIMSAHHQAPQQSPVIEGSEVTENEKLAFEEQQLPTNASAPNLVRPGSQQQTGTKVPSPKFHLMNAPPRAPHRLNGVSSTTSLRGPSSVVYTQNGTYFGALPPQSRGSNSLDYSRAPERTSFNDYDSYMPQQQGWVENEDIQPLDPTPPRRVQRQASIDPIPTHVQSIPANMNGRSRSNSQLQRPGYDWRSGRNDSKRRSYLSDIRSEGYRPEGYRVGQSPQGSFYGQNGQGPGQYYASTLGQYGKAGDAPVGEVMRLPLTWWMNSNAKNHFVAMIAEFVGTTMFLFFAFAGTQVANADSRNTTTITNVDLGFNPLVLLYTAVSFGFSLMVNAWIFFRISGGLFNPAVTLAMVMVKSLDYVRGVLLFIAQICGSLLASVLVRALFPTPLNVRTTLGEGTSIARGIFIEAILTAELVFTIFMLAKEKHRATYMAPVGIGLALFIAELVGVFYTGGSLNPARSFGPCAITGVWDKEHYIYWLGPGIGALIAVIFYKFIKILEYEIANPGQDDDREEFDVREERENQWKQSKEDILMRRKDLENQTIAEEREV